MRLQGISKKALGRIAKAVQGSDSTKKATMDEEIWDMADRTREALGDGEFIEALIKAMSTEEAMANIEFIMRMHEIPLYDYTDDEEEEYIIKD